MHINMKPFERLNLNVIRKTYPRISLLSHILLYKKWNHIVDEEQSDPETGDVDVDHF